MKQAINAMDTIEGKCLRKASVNVLYRGHILDYVGQMVSAIYQLCSYKNQSSPGMGVCVLIKLY